MGIGVEAVPEILEIDINIKKRTFSFLLDF